MKALLLLIGILCFSKSVLPKENVGHILFYQTLSELPESETLNYIKSFRLILSQNLSQELRKALETKSSSHCVKKKRRTCHPGLYGENICFSKSQKMASACAKAGKRKRFSTFFADPAFHRISWNSLGLRINKVCSRKKHFSCIKLFQLKESTLQRNRKHLHRARKVKVSK